MINSNIDKNLPKDTNANYNPRIVPMKRKIIWLSQNIEKNDNYEILCCIAKEEPHLFWETIAEHLLYWDKKFTTSFIEEKNEGSIFRWFPGGKINISANCLDRHLLAGNSGSKALIWESEDTCEKHFTFLELSWLVCKAGNALIDSGIESKDIIVIYMPLIPEAIISILACNRIGAIPCIVYSGISGIALAKRIDDCNAKLIIAADGTIHNKDLKDLTLNVRIALARIKRKLPVVLVERAGPRKVKFENLISWDKWISGKSCELPYRRMQSEDTAFMIYTSGTTGKPKLVVHKIAGILTSCHLTTLWCFNAKPGDIIWCTADLGWITSMAHVIYGPLCNGITTLIYEGSFVGKHSPLPWAIIKRHKVTHWKTAPSAIRLLKKQNIRIPSGYKMTSLKLVFCSGEPLDHQSWHWIQDQILKDGGFIVDGWGQTETCSTMICSLPGLGWDKPGSVGKPLPGAHLRIATDKLNQLQANQKGLLQIVGPWPGLMDSAKSVSPQNPISTGDLAWKDQDGLFYIVGRNDNVLNTSGHRISLAEVEQAIKQHPIIVDVAAVSRNHDIKGQCIAVFVTTLSCATKLDKLKLDLQNIVEKFIGRYATPTEIHIVTELPKTHNGKIARGYLTYLVSHEKSLKPIDTSMIKDISILHDLESKFLI